MSTKGNIQDVYPLTPMQEGMLFHALNENTASAYFEQMSYRLKGNLEIDIIKESLKELMKRHDILRTAFVHEREGRPIQVVLKERPIDFTYEDIRDLGDDLKKEEYVKRSREKDRQRSFNLSKDVLLRACLIRLETAVYDFTWSHPHIIMDGWCLGIIISEFMEIYRNLLARRPYKLPFIQPYKRYIEWLEKRDINGSLTYWARTLADYNEPAVIPRIISREANKMGFKKEMVRIPLGLERTAYLREFAGRNQTTLSNVMQVLWAIVMSKLNGQRDGDVVFGLVVSGRPSEIEGIETMVGLFINTIPVRIRFKDSQLFSQSVRELQAESTAAEPHHYCQLMKIQAQTIHKQNLIDHLFSFKNFPAGEKLQESMNEQALFKVSNIQPYEHNSFDFVLSVEARNEIAIRFEYNAFSFDPQMIRRIADHYEKSLQQDLDHVSVEQLKQFESQRKKQIQDQFNEDLELE